MKTKVFVFLATAVFVVLATLVLTSANYTPSVRITQR